MNAESEISSRLLFCRTAPDTRGALAPIDADEDDIEASFREAIHLAKQQESISLMKRAEATYAEYHRRKKEGVTGA